MSEELARKFHDTYERLAPDFGYATRDDTKSFDPTSPNGRLMIAVCGEVAGALEQRVKELEAALSVIAQGEISLSPHTCLSIPKDLRSFLRNNKKYGKHLHKVLA